MLSLNKKRWLFAADGFLAMLCIGMINNWSVFVRPLEAEFGWLRSETSMIFSIVLISFNLGGLLGGLMQKKFPSQLILCIAALLIGAGFILSSLTGAPWHLCLSYGLLCGTGVGMGYNSAMSTAVKWFPDKQGFLSGILLMSYGIGSSLWGSAAVFLMSRLNWAMAFRILGIVPPLLIITSAVFMRNPTADQWQFFARQSGGRGGGPAEDRPPLKMIGERSYWGFGLWVLLLNSAGLAFFGHAAPLSAAFTGSASLGGYLAGLIHIFNGVGRFAFGWLLDLFGTKRCMHIISAAMICTMLMLAGVSMGGSLVLLAAGFIIGGFSFGGVTPSISAFVIKTFGQKYYPANYSLINMAGMPAAFLGPYLTGVILTKTADYTAMFALTAAFCVLSIPAILLIRRHAPGR
ncbi:MAG: MFS transporter [Treponema sp.]|jgi:OFA family oxalate/formate antiporter-like MFS transporter|nr:MFS transporter [Treponema sp.]